MNMRDIMESYRKGNLHMFEKSELEGLLCSLFADTELRSSNIQEIKTGVTTSQIQSPQTSSVPFNNPQITTTTSSPMINNTPTLPVNHALNYTPDDDMEVATGWGDDDDEDLFADEETSAPNVIETKPSRSLEPSPLGLDLDMEDASAGGGWGDADEDLFTETTINNVAKMEDKNGTRHSEAKTQAPSLNIQGIDDEIDQELNEGEGWGWEDDDDFFKEDDFK